MIFLEMEIFNDIHDNVNPGLYNQPLDCSIGRDTIYVSYCDYLEGTPTINKPWFINPELTLYMIFNQSRGMEIQVLGMSIPLSKWFEIMVQTHVARDPYPLPADSHWLGVGQNYL